METVLVEDVLHRFMLERAGVRGVLVRLGAAWREVAGRSAYPAALRSVLGQTLALQWSGNMFAHLVRLPAA